MQFLLFISLSTLPVEYLVWIFDCIFRLILLLLTVTMFELCDAPCPEWHNSLGAADLWELFRHRLRIVHVHGDLIQVQLCVERLERTLRLLDTHHAFIISEDHPVPVGGSTPWNRVTLLGSNLALAEFLFDQYVLIVLEFRLEFRVLCPLFHPFPRFRRPLALEALLDRRVIELGIQLNIRLCLVDSSLRLIADSVGDCIVLVFSNLCVLRPINMSTGSSG